MPPEIEQLYREHRAGLVRLVERELHDHHDAEDVVQTAFLDAQRALERGTIPRNPRAWLATIALNAGRRLRRRRLNAEPLEEYAVQEASGMPELRAALANLPPEQRAAVVYRDLLGLSYDETAEQMGTSVNAVTMLLHRGRRRLRQTLGITTAGVALSRWLRRTGLSQVAAVKTGAAVVVAAGLATSGMVVARVVAPVGADAAAQPAPRPGHPSPRTGRSRARVPESDATGRAFKTDRRSGASAVAAATQRSDAGLTPPARSSTSAAAHASLLQATLGARTVSLPPLPIPTAATTVTVGTPITTVTVTTPTLTTATVTTPIVTVTVPIP